MGIRKIEPHVQDKRDELVWALSAQGYSASQIGSIFNLHRSTVIRIVAAKPDGWKVKWVKA